VPVQWQGATVHAVVAHFGLIHSSRVRQVQKLAEFIEAEVPPGEMLVVAGDFNDWGDKLDAPMQAIGLERARSPKGNDRPTFPSLVPIFHLDRVYLRGMRCASTFVPRGSTWSRMSDHLPLVVEIEPL
jgi:endonuclease/exonuclease/phosphatase family metal-dependent hydrolase